MPLGIRSLPLKNRHFHNWHTEVEDHWNYEDFIANRQRRVAKGLDQRGLPVLS